MAYLLWGEASEEATYQIQQFVVGKSAEKKKGEKKKIGCFNQKDEKTSLRDSDVERGESGCNRKNKLLGKK